MLTTLMNSPSPSLFLSQHVAGSCSPIVYIQYGVFVCRGVGGGGVKGKNFYFTTLYRWVYFALRTTTLSVLL